MIDINFKKDGESMFTLTLPRAFEERSSHFLELSALPGEKT